MQKTRRCRVDIIIVLKIFSCEIGILEATRQEGEENQEDAENDK